MNLINLHWKSLNGIQVRSFSLENNLKIIYINYFMGRQNEIVIL